MSNVQLLYRNKTKQLSSTQSERIHSLEGKLLNLPIRRKRGWAEKFHQSLFYRFRARFTVPIPTHTGEKAREGGRIGQPNLGRNIKVYNFPMSGWGGNCWRNPLSIGARCKSFGFRGRGNRCRRIWVVSCWIETGNWSLWSEGLFCLLVNGYGEYCGEKHGKVIPRIGL